MTTATHTHQPTAPVRRGLPSPLVLLASQIRYQVRLLITGPRALIAGVGLPLILLLINNSKHGPGSGGQLADFATLGLTITAWTTHGIGLVAARQAGVLKRWRATPLPRWCYFAGRITASVAVAALAGAVTTVVGTWLYGLSFSAASAGAVVLVLVLSAFAWASAATALTAVIPTVEAASPIMILSYFPIILISGLFGTISMPSWLTTLATYLPGQPMIDSLTRIFQHAGGTPHLVTHELLVLAGWTVAGLLISLVLFRWEPHRPHQHRRARPTTDSPAAAS
jgi:ABC-2 type transport system permease protein